MSNPYYVPKEIIETDPETGELVFFQSPGWYYYGEDGPSCPSGPYPTVEDAEKAFDHYMDGHWESLVGSLDSLLFD